MKKFRSTTIVAIINKGEVALGGDGQVTVGETIVKQSSKKIRKIYNGKVLVGFAGAAADAFTLFDKFEKKLDQYKGNLYKSAVELAKEWRTDRMLRRLEALLAVANKESVLMISGTGDVIEPDDGIVAIGSGAPYALAASRVLKKHTKLGAKDIVLESMKIASSICIYTNDKIMVEEIEKTGQESRRNR